MDRDQTKVILRTIVNTFPTFKMENPAEMVDVWAAVLDDVDYYKISQALKTYIRTDKSGFAPSIGQLCDIADKLEHSEEMSVPEMWAMYRKAISRANYYAAEDFEKFPEELQAFVGNPEALRSMALLPTETIESVEKSNFEREFKAFAKSRKERRQMPISVKQAFGIAEKKTIKIEAKPVAKENEKPEPTTMPDQMKQFMDDLRRLREANS